MGPSKVFLLGKEVWIFGLFVSVVVMIKNEGQKVKGPIEDS